MQVQFLLMAHVTSHFRRFALFPKCEQTKSGPMKVVGRTAQKGWGAQPRFASKAPPYELILYKSLRFHPRGDSFHGRSIMIEAKGLKEEKRRRFVLFPPSLTNHLPTASLTSVCLAYLVLCVLFPVYVVLTRVIV
jgi:hypothetical protein